MALSWVHCGGRGGRVSGSVSIAWLPSQHITEASMHNTERQALATIACASAVASLTARQREALALVALCGLTREEAAAALGICERAVYARLERARERARGRG